MNHIIRSGALFILAIISSIPLWAKETGAVATITIKEDSLWQYFPWIWVIGGAIFILLLVAMISTHQKKYN